MSCIVYKFTNCDNFYTEKNLLPKISLVMKTFNDYDENNYLICDGPIISKEDRYNFNLEIYNNIHEQYLKYYQENNNIKIIIYAPDNNSYKWCKQFLKFFNVFYYTIKFDINTHLNEELKISDRL